MTVHCTWFWHAHPVPCSWIPSLPNWTKMLENTRGPISHAVSTHIPSISFLPLLSKDNCDPIFWEHRSYQKVVFSDLSIRSRRHLHPYVHFLATYWQYSHRGQALHLDTASHALACPRTVSPAACLLVCLFPSSFPCFLPIHFHLLLTFQYPFISLISPISSSFVYLYPSFCSGHSCQYLNENILHCIDMLHVYVYIVNISL